MVFFKNIMAVITKHHKIFMTVFLKTVLFGYYNIMDYFSCDLVIQLNGRHVYKNMVYF